MEIGLIFGALICLAVLALWPSKSRRRANDCENCGLRLDREYPCDYCGWQP